MVDIKQSIINTLDRYFGIETYGEKVEQCFNTPSFYVKELSFGYEPQVGNFQKNNYSFVIQYFPSKTSRRKNKDCREMNTELMKLFRFYEDLRLHPTSMSSNVLDETGQFMVDFDVRHKIVAESGPMFEELEVRSDLKDE